MHIKAILSYIAISLIAFPVSHVGLIVLLGPCKSLSNIWEAVVGLNHPRYEQQDPSSVYSGILMHAFCWLLFFAILGIGKAMDSDSRKNLYLAFVMSWIVGAVMNFSWEVLGNI